MVNAGRGSAEQQCDVIRRAAEECSCPPEMPLKSGDPKKCDAMEPPSNRVDVLCARICWRFN
jgi:hypothetical protein